MKIAVCDDEGLIGRQIKELIMKQMPGACVGLYDSGEELLAAKRQYDIVFLDIKAVKSFICQKKVW